MRPLTDDTPKPLLEVGGKPLLAHHLERLVAEGFAEIVINASYHARQIVEYCGDGRRWGCHIEVVVEPTPLETAGGILNALSLLGDKPFVVINGDVFTDYPLDRLRLHDLGGDHAHLVMIPNPAHHPKGDFELSNGRIGEGCGPRVTFSGLSVMSKELFAGLAPGKSTLRPRLEASINSRCLSGELWSGLWSDVGTPERLEALEASLRDHA